MWFKKLNIICRMGMFLSLKPLIYLNDIIDVFKKEPNIFMHEYVAEILGSNMKKLANCIALGRLFQNFKTVILNFTCLMISGTLEGTETFYL